MKVLKLLMAFVLIVPFAYADSYSIDENVLKVVDGNVGIGTITPRSKLDVKTSASIGNLAVGGISTSAIDVGFADALIYLKMEDNAASTVVTDALALNTCTSNVNTSTLTTAAKINNGFLFNGSIQISCGALIKPTGAFSFNVWMNSSSSGDAGGVLFGNRSSSSPNVGFLVTKGTDPSKIRFLLDTGSSIASINSSTTINDGTFRMITGIFDGANIKILVNGVQEATTAISYNSGSTGADAGIFYIDYLPVGSSVRFIGRMDNLNVWPRVLTTAEIALLYNAGLGTDELTGTTGTVSATTEIIKTGSYPLLKVSSSSSGDGDLMTVKSDGNVGIGTTKPSAGLVVMNGNVGIGTTSSPSAKVKVVGTVAATAFTGDGSALTGISSGSGINWTDYPAISSLSNDDKFLISDGGTSSGLNWENLQAILPLNHNGWTDGGTNVYTSTTTDTVGIGTTTPNAATLEIVKNTTQPILKISSTASGNGNYLTVTSSGNVGIGTATPGVKFGINAGNTFSVDSNGNSAIISGSSTTDAMNIKCDSATTGNCIDASSSSSGLTGPLAALNASNSSNTSSVLQSLTAGVGNAGFFQNTGSSGGGIRVNDVSGDTTPFFTDVNGNVGVGTFTPNAHFDIRNEGGLDILHVGSTSTDGTGAYLLINSSGNVGIGTSSPNGALVVMNGNVGIGTLTPSSELDAGAGIVRAGGFRMGSTTLTGISGSANIVGSASPTITGSLSTAIIRGGTAAGSTLTLRGTSSASADATSGIVLTYGASGGSEGMWMNGLSGNVGLGTYNPKSKIVVNGGVGIGTTLTSSFINTAAPSGGLIVEGNVGIGTTTPPQKLYAVGTIEATTGFKAVNAAGITDNTSYWLCADAICTTKCQVTIKGGIITGCP